MRRRMIWYESQPLTFVALEDGTFSFTNNVEYKIGGNAWQTLSSGESTPIVPQGKKIKWRGKLTNPVTDVGIGTFSSTGRYTAEGNPISLIYYNRFAGVKTLGKRYWFCKLFFQNTNLISIKNLKLVATSIFEGTYQNMFYACYSLVEACDTLPATSIPRQAYQGMFSRTAITKAPYIAGNTTGIDACLLMFYNCTNLTTVERIPNAGYYNNSHKMMFANCTSLVEIPSFTIGGASQVANSMFYGCTSLIDARGITLNLNVNLDLYQCCYSMFSGCTSLVYPPKKIEYNGTSTQIANRMFYGCTSLIESPEILIQTLPRYALQQMFDGCSSLQRIKCLAIDKSATNCLINWVRGVSSTGTFIKHPDATWATGNNGIPANWTVEDAEI